MSNIESGVHGRYMLRRTRYYEDGTTESTVVPWFSNLIVNNGLDMLGTRSFNGCINQAFVGTGNATPSNTDTSLASQVASTGNEHNSRDASRTSNAPYYFGRVYGFRFSKGAAQGNLTEIGVGRGSSNLFSRSLIVDEQGNPTTLTITDIDVLDVYYEFRCYVSHDPVSWSETVMGTQHTGTLTARNQGTLEELYNPGGSLQPYTGGNYYRDAHFFYDVNEANGGPGISSLSLGGSLDTLMTFDPPIPKDNTRTFEFSIRNSWARRIFDVLFNYDGSSSLADWNAIGNISVDNNTGFPSPSYRLEAGSYAYQDTGRTDLASTRIIFDVLLDYSASLIFGADASGSGPALFLEFTNAVVDTIGVGGSPRSIALNNNYAFVVNDGHGSVSVIDLSTNAVVDTIAVGSYPKAVALNNNYAFVTDVGSNNISVIDLSTNAVVDTIAVGSYPKAVALNNNYAFVTDGDSNNVSVIDLSTNAVVDTIGVGGSPQSVALNNNYAYVANGGSNNVSVIDLSTNAVVDTIGVGGSPQSVALNNNYACVANSSSNNVSVIDLSTNAVVDTIAVGRYPKAVALNNNYAYVANGGSNNVSVIDLSTNAVVDTIAVGSYPKAVALNNNYAYVANGGSNNVSVIDLTGAIGLTTASDWSTVAEPTSNTFPVYHGWHNFQILVDSSGTSAGVLLDGVTIFSGVSISQNGGYIGLSAKSGAHFDNVNLHAVP